MVYNQERSPLSRRGRPSHSTVEVRRNRQRIHQILGRSEHHKCDLRRHIVSNAIPHSPQRLTSTYSLADYFVLRRKKVRVSHLYSASQDSIYWYWKGFNWRAIVALVVCVAILLRELDTGPCSFTLKAVHQPVSSETSQQAGAVFLLHWNMSITSPTSCLCWELAGST